MVEVGGMVFKILIKIIYNHVTKVGLGVVWNRVFDHFYQKCKGNLTFPVKNTHHSGSVQPSYAKMGAWSGRMG